MIEDPPPLAFGPPVERPRPEIVERFRGAPTSFVVDAMNGSGALDWRIKPIVGRELVAITISNSSHSRDNPGQYVFEAKIDERTTLLRWQGTIGGHKIESLELLTDDENGLLVERTVAYRPFPALKIFRDRLIALNAGKLPADMWDYQN